MANRVRRIDEATIAGRTLQVELGAVLREARLARGLRQIDVARAMDVSHARISRVELGVLRDLAVADAARHGAAVGLRLHARFYPRGSGLRDVAQLDLLRRLRARIGDAWSWQLEAPLNIPGDMRAFDLLLTRGGATIAVEAITRLRDAQAQLREATRKQRDGQVSRLVVLLSATLAALANGEDPGQNGIVLL